MDIILNRYFLLSVYLFYTYRAGAKQKKINDPILRARVLFAQDSYAGYTGALKHYKEILQLDESHADSLARAAFSCAVLAGEHNADRKLIDEGKRFLDRARTKGKKTSIVSAAEGMLELYGGGGPSEAVRILEKAIKQHHHDALAGLDVLEPLDESVVDDQLPLHFGDAPVPRDLGGPVADGSDGFEGEVSL